MGSKVFTNADGEMLILPQVNGVKFVTEFGIIVAEPGELVVIPKGVRF